MHLAAAARDDFGMLTKNDVIMPISNSGKAEQILKSYLLFTGLLTHALLLFHKQQHYVKIISLNISWISLNGIPLNR